MVGPVAEEDDMNPVGAGESPVVIIVDIEYFDDMIVVADALVSLFESCDIVAIDHNTLDDKTAHVVFEWQDLSGHIHVLSIGPGVPVARTEPEVDQATLVPERGCMYVIGFEGRIIPGCVVQS